MIGQHPRHRLLLLSLAGFALTACADPGQDPAGYGVSPSTSRDTAQGAPLTLPPTRLRDLVDADARAALDELYRRQPGARRLAEQARAVLVFPTVTQAGLGIGGFYGGGVMFRGGEPVGYYELTGGTSGLQAGAQSFSQGYFFNSEEALRTFRDRRSLEFRAAATAVAADFGASGEVSTSTLQQPLVVATWGQSGLMAAAVLEGAKITEIRSEPAETGPNLTQ